MKTYANDAELIAYIADWKPEKGMNAKGMNAVPGVPLSRFSISGGAMEDLGRLVTEGRLELVKNERGATFVRVAG